MTRFQLKIARNVQGLEQLLAEDRCVFLEFSRKVVTQDSILVLSAKLEIWATIKTAYFYTRRYIQ